MRETRRESLRRVKKESNRRKDSSRRKAKSSAMATGSDRALSPTIDNVKAPAGKEGKNGMNQLSKSLQSEVPPPLRTTDDSSDEPGGEGFFSEEEQDENAYNAAGSNYVSVPETNYISDGDPYIYSDDSESFSDAYFKPGFNDYPAVLYPGTSTGSMPNSRLSQGSLTPSRDSDSIIGKRIPVTTQPEVEALTVALPQGYGTLGTSWSDRSAGSPFKMPGSIASIREDSPVDEEQQQLLPPDPNLKYYGYPHFDSPAAAAEFDAQYLKQTKKDRRKFRKQQKAAARQRQMQMIQSQQRQREQAVRERTVNTVKGRPQDDAKYRDPCFAVLFIAQLLIVVGLAINSSAPVMFSKETPSWGILPTSSANVKSSVSTKSTKTSTITSHSSSLTATTNGKNKNRMMLQNNGGYNVGGQHSMLRRLTSESTATFSESPAIEDVMENQNTTVNPIGSESPTDDSTSSVMHASHSSKGDYSESDGESPETQEQPLTTSPPSSKIKTTSSVEGPNSFTIDYNHAIGLIGMTGFIACSASSISFVIMLIMSKAIIYVALVFSILIALAWGVLGLTMNPYGAVSIVGFVALPLTLGYTIYNWQRIPFASTNLYTAVCAMQCTNAIPFLGISAMLVAFAWCVVWSIAFIGAVDRYDPGKCSNLHVCVYETPLVRIGLYGFFMLSFYWTNNVIKNIVRVTVASAIGTWWYYPQEINQFCSPAVGQPLLRSLTKSFGSICLGSLVSQAVQAVVLISQCFCCASSCRRHVRRDEGDSEIAHGAVEAVGITNTSASDDKTLPSAVSEKVSALSGKGSSRIGSYIRCFNRWAYSYIGMYGYDFREGGEKAIQLFEAREWMEVVRDNLIPNVLVLSSILLGGILGCGAMIAEEFDGFEFTTLHQPITTAFVVGSILGFVLSNVLFLGVLGSAVNTILVCFAAGPFEFDRNHPRLSREMRDIWSQQVWEPSA